MPTLSPIQSPEPGRTSSTSRILKAARELVFRAWTEAEHLKNWWGPNGFSNTFYIFEPKPGGRWEFTMHGPDGKDYANESVFVVVDQPSKIIFDHVCAPLFQLQATFDEAGPGLTRITFTQIFESAELFEKIKDFIAEKNEENLDRLEEELKKMN